MKIYIDHYKYLLQQARVWGYVKFLVGLLVGAFIVTVFFVK